MIKFIFLSPYLESKIWGGHRLESFNIALPNKPIGEAWVISAYPNKSSMIVNEKFKGLSLQDFYNQYRDFFGGSPTKEYPLLTKILDCNDDLSIQVHPNQTYANKNNVPSKNEAWYIIDAPENAKIVYGHTAKTRNEFSTMVKNKKWKDLLIYKNIKPGDLINVPAGTVHALTKGLLVLEIQQSIDLTYRLYDYERKDNNRELHIKQSIESSNIPFVEQQQTLINELNTPFFNVHIIENNSFKRYSFKNAKWIQCVVISGEGKIDFFKKIKKGDCFVINSRKKHFILNGKIKMFISYIKN